MFGLSNVTAGFDLDTTSFEKELEATPDALLLDVRTAFEFEEGHIPGAVNMDVYQPTFLEEAEKLDRSRPVFVYCRSGNRSYTVAQALVQMGFQHVRNLQHGIISWEGDTE